MKKTIALVALSWCFATSWGTAQNCLPGPDSLYLYYANLKVDTITPAFNKDSLDALLASSTTPVPFSAASVIGQIEMVEKAFPSAWSSSLQKSLAIYSAENDLEGSLSQFSDIFNYAEIYCYSVPTIITPNDWLGPGSSLKNDNTHLELINARQAWEVTTSDPRILIGIHVTYLDENHEDLTGQVHSVLANVSNPQSLDDVNFGHGSHVSGCAAARTDNGIGIAGIGYNSKIVYLGSRFLSTSNLLPILDAFPEVRVVNLSIGSCRYSSSIEEIVNDELKARNVVVVAAAGNGKWNSPGSGCTLNDPTQLFYPASYDNAISVTSVGHINPAGDAGNQNWEDCHRPFINAPDNETHMHNEAVDICAPGYLVLSTVPEERWPLKYHSFSGTSMASPIVAGVCALVASVNPCLSADDIKDIVLSTADPSIYSIPENQPYLGQLGSGRVDAYAAILKAIEYRPVYVQNKNYGFSFVELGESFLTVGNNVDATKPAGDVIISPTANVTFSATHRVELARGFEVKAGGNFEIVFGESDCY